MSAERFRYKAFISYSHRDAKVAQWLHRALESYRTPKHLIGRETSTGPIQKRLGTIFRDRDELPVAADLTGQINDALADTQFLIVLCSKTSATSKWVNQEVINFKRLKGAASIIAVIIDGEPFASNQPGQEREECFVPALRFQVAPNGILIDQPAEPIAADLRPGKDGKRMVKLKIIAGLLGVGLDELVQREALRRQRFMTAVTFASLLGIGVMGALTFNAIQARNDAEVAQERAERQKSQAEGLIEFMLGDLRKKLEPVGRLDVLDSVGERALTYFGTLRSDEFDPDTLGRRARTLHLIGEIQELRGNLPAAIPVFQEAAMATKELLEKAPDNAQRLFDHAQSQYWIGYAHFRSGQATKAEQNFKDYNQLAQKLSNTDPSNLKWKAEVGHAATNLGVVHLQLGRAQEAAEDFKIAVAVNQKIAEFDASNAEAQLNLGKSTAWLADAYEKMGSLSESIIQRQAEMEIYRNLQGVDPKNKTLAQYQITAQKALGILTFNKGDYAAANAQISQNASFAQNLYQSDPDNKKWLELYASLRLDLAELNLIFGKHREAKPPLAEAGEIARKLVEQNPKSARWRISLLYRHTILELIARLNDWRTPEYRKGIEKILLDLRERVGKEPNDANASYVLARLLLTIGDLSRDIGDKAMATKNWHDVITTLEPSMPDLGVNHRALLLAAYNRIGDSESARTTVDSVCNSEFKRPDITALCGERVHLKN